jgi:uncharacterized protein (TIGR03118 family)
LLRRFLAVLAGGFSLATPSFWSSPARADVFSFRNLVTDDPTFNSATLTDSSLKNAWGVSATSSSPFWVSNNGTGTSTLYQINPVTDLPTKFNLTVTIPGDGSVTGQVANPVTNPPVGVPTAFNNDSFLFVSEDGTISGWRGALGTNAEVLATGSAANVYKGTTAANINNHVYLYAANFGTGNIDIKKGDTGAPDLTGRFNDPNLTAGYAPFNVQKLGNTIYVTYALKGAGKDDDPGVGHGFVNAFDLQGNLIGRVGTMGALNSPWGLAIAPATFGAFAGDLLVGNFGDGKINVFDPTARTFLGQLNGANGQPLVIDGLWALIAGNGVAAGSTDRIYFSAGPNDEAHGVFGVIVPEPSSLVLFLSGITIALWAGRRRVRRG